MDQFYLESLPKKRMGAGCLFFDEQGRLLLVKPRTESSEPLRKRGFYAPPDYLAFV